MTFEEIRDAALQLPREERAELASDLLGSLEGSQLDYERLWQEEAARRMQAIEVGSEDLTPAEEVYAELRAELTSNQPA